MLLSAPSIRTCMDPLYAIFLLFVREQYWHHRQLVYSLYYTLHSQQVLNIPEKTSICIKKSLVKVLASCNSNGSGLRRLVMVADAHCWSCQEWASHISFKNARGSPAYLYLYVTFTNYDMQVRYYYARIHKSGSIWIDQFKLMELDEILRQREDNQFARL